MSNGNLLDTKDTKQYKYLDVIAVSDGCTVLAPASASEDVTNNTSCPGQNGWDSIKGRHWGKPGVKGCGQKPLQLKITFITNPVLSNKVLNKAVDKVSGSNLSNFNKVSNDNEQNNNERYTEHLFLCSNFKSYEKQSQNTLHS